MALQYHCDNEARRQAVSEHATLNGVDYLEVLDQDAPTGSPRQQTLLVRCLKEVPIDLSGENVLVEGGVRVTSVEADWAVRADDTADLLSAGSIDAPENAFFNALAEADHVLVVRTNTTGDFSTYSFSLVVSSTDSGPPVGFDPILSQVDFSFKVECPSEFDCKSEPDCPTHGGVEPPIDYLAKDYSSFRRLMLDRLALTMPEWTERNPADLGVALVELLAYAADQLSYYQDEVATEAYLGTAHKRVSVRRHARLLDYHMHDGSNSRAWVCLSVTEGSGADGYTLAGIHRRTALGTAPEEARGCSSESGIMVLEQKPARKQGAPNRCCHRTNPTVSASSLTTIAWWPMPACSCRPPWPGTWACENSSTITLTSAARRDGRTLGTRC